MKNLLQIELIKNFNSTAFKTFIILHLLLFSLVIFAFSQIHFSMPGFSVRNLFTFPHVWSSIAWVASWFNILLTILIIVLVGNEYAFKTFRQQVVNGLSREDLLVSKLITILMIALYSFVLVCFSSMVYGAYFSKNFSLQDLFAGMDVMFIYFYQAFAYMIIGLLFIVIFKNTALAIVLFFCYRIIIEPLFRLMFLKSVRPFFPMKMISNLTPFPETLTLASAKRANSPINKGLGLEKFGAEPQHLDTWENIALVTAYLALFIIITYFILKKRDL